MRSEEEKKEQKRKAQKKYYEKNKEYYRKQSLEESKRVRKERNLYKEIIKEVREYLDTLEKQPAYKFVEVDNHTEMRVDENEYLIWCKYNKLLKILDKENK